jgi:single-strand DNA-binding protein
MGKSINKVILVGRLGRDPELKYTATGTPFCRFSLATDDSWTDKGSGEKTDRTEWHNIVVWDKLAEICNNYLTKGKMVYIEGSLQTREWDDKEGVKRKTTEIRCKDMMMLSGGRDGGGGAEGSGGGAGFPRQSSGGPGPSSGGGESGSMITDDDIPF